MVFVFDIGGDLEIVGEPDCVLERDADADTVAVFRIVFVIAGERVTEILVVDVFDWEVDPEFVVELVWDLDLIELNEYVGVWDWDLDTIGEPEYEDDLDEEDE